MTRTVAWALVALLAATGAQANEWESAPIKEHLPNGLRIVVEDNDHTATVVMSALVRVTALHEPRGKTGIRQLTTMLLARGDGHREAMAKAAIRGSMSVAPDYAELILGAPVESLGECALAMRDVLFRPQFTERALEIERTALVRGLLAREEVPVSFALRRLYEQIYPTISTADSSAGDPLEVARITLADVNDFYAAHYLPNVTVIAVSGGVDAGEVRDSLTRAMRGVLPGPVRRTRPEPPPAAERLIEIDVGGPTSVYVVGGRAVALSDPSYPPMAVGMAILGSGMGSRLYRALRVEDSLAYTIATELTPGATAPSGFVLATADPENLDVVAHIVDREIADLIDGQIDTHELQRAKQYLIGRHALRRQRNHEVSHYLGVFELLGGPEGYRRDARLSGEIATVTGADVVSAMRRLFDPAWAVRLQASN